MTQVKFDDKDFQQLIANRAQALIGLASFLAKSRSRNKILIRPFLGEFFSQSMQLEELLDTYNAHNNCRWCSFRSLTAAIKLFSDVSYELLHIRYALPAYRLLPIEQDFVKATNDALEFTGCILQDVSKQILVRAGQLGLSVPPKIFC